MIDAGTIHLADVGQETRRLVLVVSNQRFHRSSGRVFVCPRLTIEGDLDELFPWWIDSDEGVFALDQIASIPVSRLLEQRGALTRIGGARMRRAIAAIT
ncbi:MAG: type II toxin-antitoxin system PemK/MazF family toxin [Actinomycetota bacterium]